MYKNQLQELAQRSCFNLPSYGCIREGPDHAPRFNASVNFNGEMFESPTYCTTLRQAEHSAAEVALNALSSRGPSKSLTARILDETGVYKNLLQGTAHRAGVKLPAYSTVKSGPGHVPVFTSTVEIAGMDFTGESAKTKKQAEKNAAIAAWTALKTMPNLNLLSQRAQKNEVTEGDQVAVAKGLSNSRPRDECKHQLRRRKNQNNPSTRKGKKNASSSSNNSSLNNQFQQPPRRPIDLLMDLPPPAAAFPKGPTQHKQSCFVALLPPPPTSSKIVPLTSSQVPKMEEEGHKGNEEFDFKRKGTGTSNPIFRPIPPPLPNTLKFDKIPPYLLSNTTAAPARHEQTQMLYGYGSSKFTPSPLAVPTGCHVRRPMSTGGGGGFNPHRIAPAVQIRSVIPVCAAPPPVRSLLNPPVIKESAPSSALSPTEMEISSSVSSKLNKLRL